MAVRYYIHHKDHPNYLSAVISGDSFPTTHELQQCFRNYSIFDCLRIAARRIVVHSKKSNLTCKGTICSNDPDWVVVPKPFGYDVDYIYDYHLLDWSLFNEMFPDVAVVARSGDEVLISFIVKPSLAAKWLESYSMDPFGDLETWSKRFVDLKLSIVVLAARLFNVNITLQIYTIHISNEINHQTTVYRLFRSIYIKKDTEYILPSFTHNIIDYRPPKPSPGCSCKSGY